MTDPTGTQNSFRRAGISALLIADDPLLIARATDAVDIAGGRIVAQADWSISAAAIAAQPRVDAILLEAEGVDGDRLAALLPAADALARGTGAVLIIALAPEQIDDVTVHVLGAPAQLLCASTVAERVAALIVARGTGDRVGDQASEAESERLRRLNEEVARIAETLARLTRREPDGAPPHRAAGLVGDRKLAYSEQPPLADAAAVPAQDVRRAIRARRLRDQFFPAGLFEEPAWDMLLDLFAADLEGTRVSVSSLCIAAAVAPTTALRWISKMSEAGLFERHPDPFDRRRAYLALSQPAREGLRGYIAALRRAGISIA